MSADATMWIWIGCVIFATFLGCLKERPAAGLLLGILFGPLGCILAAFLPPKGESAFGVGAVAVVLMIGEAAMGFAAIKHSRDDHERFKRETAAHDAEMRQVQLEEEQRERDDAVRSKLGYEEYKAHGFQPRSQWGPEPIAVAAMPSPTPLYVPRPLRVTPAPVQPTAAEMNRAILEKYGSRR